MFSNVSDHFLPPKTDFPSLIYDSELFPYVKWPTLNATFELLDRGIAENGWGSRPVLYDDNRDAVWTYVDLQQKVNAFGNVLRSLNVKPGDRVMWRFGEVPEAAIVQLAAWKIGAINVPSAIVERAREISYYANDTEASILITHADGIDQVIKALPELRSVRNIIVVPNTEEPEFLSYERLMAEASHTLEPYPTAPEDAASIFYTGGSTGHPKGCLHSHVAEVLIADLHCGVARGTTAEDVLFTHAPLGHAFGNGEKINFPLRFGASAVYREHVSPHQAWNILERYHVTILAGAPTMFRMMAEALPENLGNLRLAVRTVVSTGEALSQDFMDKWTHLTGLSIHNAVGMTPMRHIFCESIRNGRQIAPHHSVGRPLPGYEFRLVDDEGNPVSPGEVGRLLVRGPTGITYWNHLHPNMPDRQHQDVVNGWSMLDDAYVQDEEGWLYFVSRMDNMIVTAGRQVAAPEVEEVMGRHPAVHRVAAVGIPDALRGNIIKVFVELQPDYRPDTGLKDELVVFAKDNMALYKAPREIEFIDKIPTDAVGKIQRKILRELSLTNRDASIDDRQS